MTGEEAMGMKRDGKKRNKAREGRKEGVPIGRGQ
jgi:hypothetical protein